MTSAVVQHAAFQGQHIAVKESFFVVCCGCYLFFFFGGGGGGGVVGWGGGGGEGLKTLSMKL